ncbi:uncharacterized protein [Palaemon carinicauda]|uniref:uncharacterized protein n=1 Tax=Palaemon carinicauda TaxID=392227 RepID=UPI0035B5A727
MVMKNSKRRKSNPSMTWIEYKKVIEIIPHPWFIECLKIYGAEDSTINFLKNIMENCKTLLACLENGLQRLTSGADSLLRLLFLVAMIPMTRVPEKTEIGYQLKKGGNRINHLMSMDDIKLFAKDTKEIGMLIQTLRIISRDIKMKFGI